MQLQYVHWFNYTLAELSSYYADTPVDR